MTDQTPEAAALDTLRSYLRNGATISATDPNGRILELQSNGVWYGGLDLVFPPGVEATTAFDELRYPRAENEKLRAENERLQNELAALSQDDGKVERALIRSQEANERLAARVVELEADNEDLKLLVVANTKRRSAGEDKP